MSKITKKQLINLIKEEISEIQSTPTNRDGFKEAVQMLMKSGVPRETALDVLRRLRSEVKPRRGDAASGPEPVTLRKLGDRPLEESSEFDDLKRQITPQEEEEYEKLLARRGRGEELSPDDLDNLLSYLELTSPGPAPEAWMADTVEQPALRRPGDTFDEFPALKRTKPAPPRRDVMGGDLFPGRSRKPNNTLEEVIRREIRNFLKSKA